MLTIAAKATGVLASEALLGERWKDIVSLASFGLAGVGFPLTIAAVIFAWSQIRQARDAARRASTSAEAAQEAAEEARTSVVSRMRLSTLNRAIASTRSLRAALGTSDFVSARREVEILRDDIVELRESDIGSAADLGTAFQRHLTSLSSVDDLVEELLDSDDVQWDRKVTRDSLRKLADFLKTLEIQARIQEDT
ncbi:MAG: hypothetical protein WEB04_09540 [Dehalococcoidia bacterium]